MEQRFNNYGTTLEQLWNNYGTTILTNYAL